MRRSIKSLQWDMTGAYYQLHTYFELTSVISRGTILNSKFANYYQHDDRVVGFAFFGLSYFQPNPEWTTNGFIEHTAQFHDEDTEIHGYFKFFAEKDAAKILEDHVSQKC